jgi:hypothetical protein
LPDIVLGALIGIGGTVVGAIIGGLSSYMITRLQISAAREQLTQQLSHQEREAKRNRLAEARKELLLDLRHTISEWVECSSRGAATIVRFQKALEGKGNSTERRRATKEFFEVSERTKELTSRLSILRIQSDSKLDKLIEAVKDTQWKVVEQRLPLIEFFNSPGSADINTFESAIRTDEALLETVRKQAIQVNKRIEELLSGEPSD